VKKTLVDLTWIRRQPETATFFVPDVTAAPVKKLVAIFHATNGRLVFIEQDQLRRIDYGNA
jgi:hypothetical protein